MAREFRVLQAVHRYFREAPDVFFLCEDPAVLGAVFFVMERRRGLILRDEIPSLLRDVANYPQVVSEAFARTATKPSRCAACKGAIILIMQRLHKNDLTDELPKDATRAQQTGTWPQAGSSEPRYTEWIVGNSSVISK
jgi:aminoglycoside phosphotransferase (APT) family kinase protein